LSVIRASMETVSIPPPIRCTEEVMSDGRPGIALITCGSPGLARNVGGAITALLVGKRAGPPASKSRFPAAKGFRTQ